jgi:site-specific DNA-methyltransferase (cytosine-N4-specific)
MIPVERRGTTVMNDVAGKLKAVPWDFADAKTGLGSHAIHPYPAKFIPQIPRTLIKLFHPGGDSAVLDPFCGSGTTLVEALSAGVPSIGIDVNPLATLVTKVKTTPIPGAMVEIARNVCGRARRRLDHGRVQIPYIPRVDHWFKKPVQQALGSLVLEINAVPDQHIADAPKVALSSIIVRVSNQESDTRYAAVEKPVTIDTVWASFERAAVTLGSSLESIDETLFPNSTQVRSHTKDLMRIELKQIGDGRSVNHSAQITISVQPCFDTSVHLFASA